MSLHYSGRCDEVGNDNQGIVARDGPFLPVECNQTMFFVVRESGGLCTYFRKRFPPILLLLGQLAPLISNDL